MPETLARFSLLLDSQSNNAKNRVNRQERVSQKMKRKKLTKEKLQQLLDYFGSVGKVAADLQIPYSTLYAWYKSYDISLPPSCMTVYNELREVPLKDAQRSLIVGSILGDGFLVKSKRAKNARFSVGHCGKQLGYLKWKKAHLSPFSRPLVLVETPGEKTIQGKSCVSSGHYILNTIAHPDIEKLYKVYYDLKGKRRIVPQLVSDLDLLGLAVWIGDDGCISLRKECRYSLKGSIATHCFSDQEQEILLMALKKFFGGHANIGYANKSRNQKQIYLSGTEEVEALLDMIVPLLPKTLHYKLAPQRLNAKLHRKDG